MISNHYIFAFKEWANVYDIQIKLESTNLHTHTNY